MFTLTNDIQPELNPELTKLSNELLEVGIRSSFSQHNDNIMCKFSHKNLDGRVEFASIAIKNSIDFVGNAYIEIVNKVLQGYHDLVSDFESNIYF